MSRALCLAPLELYLAAALGVVAVVGLENSHGVLDWGPQR